MISIGKCFRLAPSVSVQCKKLIVGENATIHDRVTFIGDEIRIGDNVWIGQDSILDGTGKLVIGNGVTVGFGSYLLTHSETHWRKWKKAPIKIGDGAWLMSRVTVCPGVTIGKRAVIYNDTVVTRDVKDNQVVRNASEMIEV